VLRVGEGHRASRASALTSAILQAVTYADLFDWPLAPIEIHRFLPIAASLDDVEGALASPETLGLRRLHGLLVFPGRESIVESRRRRAAASARMWPGAVRFARAVASLPFVRLVAVTGSLAVGASEPGADVDLFIATEDRRLWLTRAAVIGVVRAGAARGVRLCPNYFLAESALEMQERDVFTAHELAQMVPIAGGATYRDVLARNAWYRDFLPNHAPAPVAARAGPGRPLRLAEAALRARPVDRLERWEMRRKVARLSAGTTSGEQQFDATACKGHFEEHRRRTLRAFDERLTGLGISCSPGGETQP